jgi:small subunit ribosomal protein S12e
MNRVCKLQVMVETNKKLGEMTGLCKLDAEGNPHKVVGCTCAVIVDFGEETEALKVLKAFIKKQKSED